MNILFWNMLMLSKHNRTEKVNNPGFTELVGIARTIEWRFLQKNTLRRDVVETRPRQVQASNVVCAKDLGYVGGYEGIPEVEENEDRGKKMELARPQCQGVGDDSRDSKLDDDHEVGHHATTDACQKPDHSREQGVETEAEQEDQADSLEYEMTRQRH